MIHFHFLVALVLLVGVVVAAPLAGTTDGNTTTSQFYLKTEVYNGDASKGGLYVQGFHTGAGIGDAVLTDNKTNARPAFLNGTYLQFDFDTTFPWGLELDFNQYYTEWLDVEINAGYGDEGFFFNGTGLDSYNKAFRGWLVCDWYHGIPQLFWQYYVTELTVPSSCATVKLCPEFI